MLIKLHIKSDRQNTGLVPLTFPHFTARYTYSSGCSCWRCRPWLLQRKTYMSLNLCVPPHLLGLFPAPRLRVQTPWAAVAVAVGSRFPASPLRPFVNNCLTDCPCCCSTPSQKSDRNLAGGHCFSPRRNKNLWKGDWSPDGCDGDGGGCTHSRSS